jgi:glycosyltransferase involved in cell wall biosynthesis
MPKLSIITINYNNLDGLKRTVESVVNQTWREFEYIVIDGGSTDGSSEYIKSHSDKIDYWISEPDTGIYNAMNKGIAKATGEYLLFLNSGDHLFSLTVLQENHGRIVDYDLIYFNIQNIGAHFSKIISYPDILRFSDLFFDILSHQATFFRKDLFDKVGLYDEKLKIVSDWKFMIVALFKHHCSYLKVGETLSTFYLDGISSVMENREMVYKERDHVLNSDFKGYVEDINQLLELRTIVSNLRKSRKIGWLVKLGLIHKF